MKPINAIKEIFKKNKDENTGKLNIFGILKDISDAIMGIIKKMLDFINPEKIMKMGENILTELSYNFSKFTGIDIGGIKGISEEVEKKFKEKIQENVEEGYKGAIEDIKRLEGEIEGLEGEARREKLKELVALQKVVKEFEEDVKKLYEKSASEKEVKEKFKDYDIDYSEFQNSYALIMGVKK